MSAPTESSAAVGETALAAHPGVAAGDGGDWVTVPREVAKQAAAYLVMHSPGASVWVQGELRKALAAQRPAPAQPPEGGGGDLEALADGFVQRVAEWDDRTSPEDWPEALLITGEELKRELMLFAEEVGTLVPATPSAAPGGSDLIRRLRDWPGSGDGGDTLSAGYVGALLSEAADAILACGGAPGGSDRSGR